MTRTEPGDRIVCPSGASWPESDLERVLSCPVCSSIKRVPLFEGLIDNVFFVAPGTWTLHRCEQCSTAYLDPRPTEQSIGRAYEGYYTHKTHEERPDQIGPLSFVRLFRRMLSNGYANRRYGTRRKPASKIGWWVVSAIPSRRNVLDTQFRHLPKPDPGARLLDVGCGNGDFLINATEAGWHATGIEIDPEAARVARGRGLAVDVGTVNDLADTTNEYDVIYLSHVIEHVHDPRALLNAVRRMLKATGVVYIDTPNIQSSGARIFGKNWRGIEAPRHLTLYNPDSLTSLLSQLGFRDIRVHKRPDVRIPMFLSSVRMTCGHSPYEGPPNALPWKLRWRVFASFVPRSESEFISLTARVSEAHGS